MAGEQDDAGFFLHLIQQNIYPQWVHGREVEIRQGKVRAALPVVDITSSKGVGEASISRPSSLCLSALYPEGVDGPVGIHRVAVCSPWITRESGRE